MSKRLRIVLAEAVVAGVSKMAWNDGYQRVIDLRGIMEEGDIFSSLHDPERFDEVRVNP